MIRVNVISDKRYKINVLDHSCFLGLEIKLLKYPIQYIYFKSVEQIELVYLNNNVCPLTLNFNIIAF